MHLSPIYRLHEGKIAAGHTYFADEGYEFKTRAAAIDEFDRQVREWPSFYAPTAGHRLVVKAVQP